jgi:hypothetical protein
VKHILTGIDLVPEAQAYIPSVIQAIVVTVTASNISTPIVGVANIAPDQTSASIRIEVPNGNARSFLVEGYRGVDGKVYFSGAATADLSGASITLPINMGFVGPGIWVSPTGSDTGGTGTRTNPYLTIARALSATTGTDTIVVSAGTYTLTVGAAAPTLQLKPGNALVCLGANFSSIIDASNTSDVLVYGAEGASIDNCKLIPASDQTAIDDRIGGLTPSRMKINGVLIDENPAVGGALDGIMLSADSLVLETAVLNTTFHGISVLNGNPIITSSVLSQNPIGISITGGNPIIRINNITLNNTGISVATATGSSPVINGNTIYCNSFLDTEISSIDIVDMRDNAWDHDATTNPTGPIVSSGNCLSGDDICVRGTNPLYIPFRSAVPGGCL